MCNSLQLHGLQYPRLLCPSVSPRECSNSCPLSRWCHLTTSSSVIPLFFCIQFFPASSLSQWVSSSHQVAKVQELQFHHQSFQWIFRVDFFFRMYWFDLLAAQGTLKNPLQHHSSKASILQCSAFFMVQLSHPYMTIRKTMALTICYGQIIIHGQK